MSIPAGVRATVPVLTATARGSRRPAHVDFRRSSRHSPSPATAQGEPPAGGRPSPSGFAPQSQSYGGRPREPPAGARPSPSGFAAQPQSLRRPPKGAARRRTSIALRVAALPGNTAPKARTATAKAPYPDPIAQHSATLTLFSGRGGYCFRLRPRTEERIPTQTPSPALCYPHSVQRAGWLLELRATASLEERIPTQTPSPSTLLR